MSKPSRRSRRRPVHSMGSRRSRVRTEGRLRAGAALSQTDTRSPRRLLDRILNEPRLAQVVPRLQPEVLHRVIQHYGLEECGELVTLATPQQLARVFDLDLWRTERPGLDEQVDADRFGVWLEVMAESGVAIAAATLAAIDPDLVTAGLAQHVLVFDHAVVAPLTSLDGEALPRMSAFDECLRCEIAGYVMVARRTESWDAIAAVLSALDESHHGYFTQVMSGCRRLSYSRPEVDGLDDLLTAGDQVMFDIAFDRERRRDTQGYVAPAEARAFLQLARQADLTNDSTAPGNAAARAYFRGIEGQTAIDPNTEPVSVPAVRSAQDVPDVSADAVVAVVELLHAAGILPRNPRARLDLPQGQARRLVRIQALMQFAHDHHPEAYSVRSGELAYLANVIVAGSSVQARPFVAEEASSAAVAVCNLGLENWPVRWSADGTRHGLSDDFLVRHDLVSAFQVGWTILYEDVCLYAAERLIETLISMRCDDGTTQAALDALGITLTKHWRAGSPWRARDDLDVMAILDAPAWAALLGLIDEFPTLHAAVGATLTGETHAVSAAAFEFISENSQIRTVQKFMELLPETLRS